MNRAPTGGNQLHKMKCMLVRYFLSCCPAQIWLTCRQCLVQSTYYRCVRSCLDDLWICADLLDDDEIALFLILTLMIGLNEHQTCQLTMRACRWLQCNAGHARDLCQVLF